MGTGEAEDRIAISDLIHEYCVRVDRYEPEQVAELFTEDCTVDYGPALGGPDTGRESLAKKLRSGLGQFEATHHQVSNLQLRFDSPDRATGICYVTAWHKGRGRLRPSACCSTWKRIRPNSSSSSST